MDIKCVLAIYLIIGITIVLVNAEDSEIETLMKDHEIIPDVLDEAPMEFLKVGLKKKFDVGYKHYYYLSR